MIDPDKFNPASRSSLFIKVENSDIFARVYNDHTRENIKTLLDEIEVFRKNWPNVLQMPPIIAVYSHDLDEKSAIKIIESGCYYFSKESVGSTTINDNFDFIEYIKNHVLVERTS